MEVELDQSALRKQLEQLQKQLELLDEEKKDTEERLQQEVKKCGDLERRGELTSCYSGKIWGNFSLYSRLYLHHQASLMVRLKLYYLQSIFIRDILEKAK